MRSLKDYEPYLRYILGIFAKDTGFHCEPGLAEILESHPRLVVAISHSTPLSWIPAISLLSSHACRLPAGRERIPVGILDRFFYSVPGLRDLASFLSQSDRPMSFDEFIAHFQRFEKADVVLFPEGSNCFFGEPAALQEFRSNRFVELAVRARAPILLSVHRGSENWAQVFSIPSNWLDSVDLLPAFAVRFLKDRLTRAGRLAVPIFPKPMENFIMHCELFHPSLAVEDLAERREERSLQLAQEASRIRSRMTAMLAEIDSQAV